MNTKESIEFLIDAVKNYQSASVTIDNQFVTIVYHPSFFIELFELVIDEQSSNACQRSGMLALLKQFERGERYINKEHNLLMKIN